MFLPCSAAASAACCKARASSSPLNAEHGHLNSIPRGPVAAGSAVHHRAPSPSHLSSQALLSSFQRSPLAWQGSQAGSCLSPAQATGISWHFTPCCAVGKGLCGLPPRGAGREGEQQGAAPSRAVLLRGAHIPPLGGEGDAPQTSRGRGTPRGAGVTGAGGPPGQRAAPTEQPRSRHWDHLLQLHSSSACRTGKVDRSPSACWGFGCWSDTRDICPSPPASLSTAEVVGKLLLLFWGF